MMTDNQRNVFFCAAYDVLFALLLTQDKQGTEEPAGAMRSLQELGDQWGAWG